MSDNGLESQLFEEAKEGEETAEVYRKEARAIYKKDPHAAAALLLDAAYANDHEDAAVQTILRDLSLARKLAPDAVWAFDASHRLLLKLGLRKEAQRVLNEAYALSKDSDYRQAAALTAMDLSWIIGEDVNGACGHGERALSADASNASALYACTWMTLAPETGTAPNYPRADVYASALARVLGTPEERAIWYAMAGNIENAIGKTPEAFESYAAAAQADRSNPYTWLRYAHLCEKFGKLSDAAAAYAQTAQIVGDAKLRGAFYRRAGVILELLGQSERASFYFSESFQCDDHTFTLPFLAAESFYAAKNDQRAVDFEHKLIELSKDDDETRSVHWLLLADIEEATGGDEACAQALEAAQSHDARAVSLARLAALYDRNGDYKNLARVLGEMADADPWGRECLRWLMGDALWRANARDEAIQQYRGTNERLGLLRLEMAYEQGDYDDAHAHLLESWIQTTQDDGLRTALTSELSVLLTERLNAPEIALQFIKNARPSDASRDLFWMRLRIHLKLEQYEDAVNDLLLLADSTTDSEESLMWQMEAALILDRELRTPEKSLDILKRIHDKAPTYAPAIILMHHIALRERRYEAVICANTWRDELQMAQDSRVHTALENARASFLLKDETHALLWFERARKLQPLPLYALRLYLRLLKKLNRWSEMIAAVKASIPMDKADSDVSLSLEQDAIASYLLDVQTYVQPDGETCLKQRKRLFEQSPNVYHFMMLLRAYLIDGTHEDCLDALRCLREKCSDESAEVKALADWVQAEILQIHPDTKQNQTVWLLLRQSADMPYGACLRAECLRALRSVPNEDLIAGLEQYAQTTKERSLILSLTREAALRAIWKERDYERARRALSCGLLHEESDRRTLWLLELFSSLTEDWQAVGYFRERLANLEVSEAARLQGLKSALLPYLDDEQTAHAVRVAQACLKSDAKSYLPLVTLSHVAEDDGDAYSLACVADRLSEASSDETNRESYGLWAAQLWSKIQNNPEQAVNSLNRILAHRPANLPAIEMIEPLLRQLGRFDQLMRVTMHAINDLTPCDVQIALLRKYARLLSEKKQDLTGATLALERIIRQAPNDIETLTLMAELLQKQSRWGEAVEVIETLCKMETQPELRRANTLKLAQIFIRELEQTDRARRLLLRHLSDFPHDRDALNLLYDIALSERNWSDAKATLEEICASQDDPDAVRRARLAFTRIAREAGWQNEMRILYEREAVAAVLDHRPSFDELAEDYRAHREIPRLIDVAKRELTQQNSPEKEAQYRGCVAALYVANQQYREALVFLSEIIHENQHTDWVYLARAQALAAAGQSESAIGEFRRTLKRNLQLNDAYEPFANVLKQTGDTISLAAVEALRELRCHAKVTPPFERCSTRAPRGFFDLDQIAISRAFADAQRYLRMMTPYVFALFSDSIDVRHIEDQQGILDRCNRLFGQNFEVKRVYTAKLNHALCRIKLDEPNAFIFDESLLDEANAIDFDFWAAYAMHQAVTGGCLIDLLDDENLTALFQALCYAKPESELSQVMKRRLFKVLPRAERKLFKDGVPFRAPTWSAFRAALQSRAACVGAVISASPACSLYYHPKDEVLEAFLVSENYQRFVKIYRSV